MIYDELFKVRFDDLGKIITGKTPSTKVNQYWDGKIQFITPKDIQVNKYVNETDRYITEEGLKAVNNILLGKGAVAVSCIGNIGYVGKIIHKAVTNQQLNAIVPNQYYDSDYVYYLMKNSWSLFKSLENQSTTVSIINKSQFSSLEVSVFKEKKKQKAIANILSSLDDKIELNSKINKNLEEIAQTLYKRWFVDFEFPNENGEPYKSSGGEMVDSELGMIPKGWDQVNFSELFDFIKGKKPQSISSIYIKGLQPYLTIANIENNERNYAVTNGLIIVTKYEAVMVMDGGSSGKIFYGLEGILGSTMSVLRSKINNSNMFLLFTAKHFELEIREKTTGSAIPHTDKDMVRKIIVNISTEKIVEFEKIIRPMVDKIICNKKEIQKLSKVRDELLPKLMSREIEVPIEE